ncbi:citrate synthase [Fomitopsis serialis]|uniref:citrate synthase n=1 Tax=Fomitopsis serialis TaxID=139415 RepID=UPI002008161F|nr:citrate synthase [Neoantrodia serialis]KAH9926219.1 citrate synthase [Neoantrodia serialis]
MLGRISLPLKSVARRGISSRRHASTKTIREALEEVIPAKQARLKQLKAEHSQTVIGDIKVEHVIGGMRGLKSMLWESSVLDPMEGIRFHGLSIPDCQDVLPAAPGGKEIIAESMLWLLMTGKVPTEAETRQLSRELAERGELPNYVVQLIDSLPQSLHPMTQLGMGVAALNKESKFAVAYEQGIKKTEYWTYTLEDSMNLLARLPALAARIFRNVYNPGKPIPGVSKDLDLVGNYVNMLGYGNNHDLTEYLRLYIALHGDHEGGNASAHTAHLVGSTLSDPYLAYSAALFALAGPLHGLANQEVLRWQLNMQKEIGDNVSHDDIKKFLWRTLQSGQVVPGYGHGVLRNPDPRFMALQKFCEARPELLEDPVIQLVRKTYDVAPGVLKEHGKTKNPYPNVDAASGCVLYHYGLTQFKYYTVIFGVSRALGCLTQLVWARALGLPLERPKSLSMDVIDTLVKSS